MILFRINKNRIQENKRMFFYVPVLVLIIAGMAACKKTHDYSLVNTTDDSETQTIIAADELNLNNEFDLAVNEAIIASCISPTTSGQANTVPNNSVLLTTISGAVIDTGAVSKGDVKIKYYGKTADQTKGRTGEITIKHAVSNGKVIPWGKQGAVAKIIFDQYEVIVLKTNKSVWLNGTCTITNSSGGLLKNITDSVLVSTHTLTDKVRAKLIFTYNDNVAIIKTWTWDFCQSRTFDYKNNMITSSITGDTTIDNIPNVATWGTTRTEQSFFTSISSPIVQRLTMETLLFSPLSGVKIIRHITEPITVFYGVNELGEAAVNGNPYGYKVTWFNAGSQQMIIQY